MRGLLRVLAATEARVAATALARPCSTRSSCPSAHSPAVRVAGVQRGGGFADVAADVDVVDEDRDFQAAGPGVVADGGNLLLVPVHEEDPLAGPVRVPAVGLVERGADRAGDVTGDQRGYPLSRAFGPGCSLRRASGAAMSSGSRAAGVTAATATISAIFLIPG